jgi:hypothetical protein
MLGNGQVRFGGRVGETDRRQRRHRAPTRPDPSLPLVSSTILVFSGLSLSPSPASTAAARRWASLARSAVGHRTTKSSA